MKESAGSHHGVMKSGAVVSSKVTPTSSASKSPNANTSENVSLLAPVFTHLNRRLQTQKQLIGPFFLSAALLAVLSAHLGPRIPVPMALTLALAIVSTLAFILNKCLAIQREDDRYVIEENVKQALAAKGMVRKRLSPKTF